MTVASVELRPARPADADAMLRLERELFAADAWSERMLREELTGPHRSYWVAADAAGLHGYAGVLTVGGEADVQTIAVAPARQGRGLGARLMRRLAREAVRAGAAALFLEVRADNRRARQLYLRLGFTEIGRRRGYYQPDGVDAVVMRVAGDALRALAAADAAAADTAVPAADTDADTAAPAADADTAAPAADADTVAPAADTAVDAAADVDTAAPAAAASDPHPTRREETA